MFSKIILAILALQQYALLHTIHPTQPLTHDQAVAVLVAAGWDESLHCEAIAIMRCESEFIPNAVGDWYYGKPRALGLFQVRWQYYDEVNCNSVLAGGFVGYGAYFNCLGGDYQPFDVVDNATVARLVYERNGGWDMWTCGDKLGFN
jgi:hypothetical protein